MDGMETIYCIASTRLPISLQKPKPMTAIVAYLWSFSTQIRRKDSSGTIHRAWPSAWTRWWPLAMHMSCSEPTTSWSLWRVTIMQRRWTRKRICREGIHGQLKMIFYSIPASSCTRCRENRSRFDKSTASTRCSRWSRRRWRRGWRSWSTVPQR